MNQNEEDVPVLTAEQVREALHQSYAGAQELHEKLERVRREAYDRINLLRLD